MPSLPVLRGESPFSVFRNMFDDFFGEPFFRSSGSEISTRLWPRVDISEDKESFLVKADIPGMSKNDIKLSVENDVLTISGEKKEERRKEEGAYSHFERVSGSFTRAFTLPENIDKDNVNARYRDGVLELRLRKTGESARKVKQIEIKD